MLFTQLHSTVLASGSAPRRVPHIPSHRFFFSFFAAILLFSGALVSHAQAPDYTSIVVFGDSLSDTGNVAHLTQKKYGFRVPGPIADYTNGRFTDGARHLPPAEQYFGVWIEQFAASFPPGPKSKPRSTAEPTTPTALPPPAWHRALYLRPSAMPTRST